MNKIPGAKFAYDSKQVQQFAPWGFTAVDTKLNAPDLANAVLFSMPFSSFPDIVAIAKGDIQAVNYFVATKYVDALAQIATSPNEKLVLMPLEAGSVIGALGGIAELAKKAGVAGPKPAGE